VRKISDLERGYPLRVFHGALNRSIGDTVFGRLGIWAKIDADKLGTLGARDDLPSLWAVDTLLISSEVGTLPARCELKYEMRFQFGRTRMIAKSVVDSR
jgi:hypothetical protein